MPIYSYPYELKPINKQAAKGFGATASGFVGMMDMINGPGWNESKKAKKKRRQEDRRKSEEWYRWAKNAKIEPRRMWRVIEAIAVQFKAEREDVERIVLTWFRERKISSRTNGDIAWSAHKKGGGR